MHINKLLKLIQDEDFRCMEIHDRLSGNIIFAFMTDGDDITIDVVYNRDADGSLGFSHASVVQGGFGFYENYIESMLVCGQCSHIKHYRGHKVVEYYRREN